MKKTVENINGLGELEVTEIKVRLFPAEVKALYNILGYSKEDLDDMVESEVEEDFYLAILDLIRKSPKGKWEAPVFKNK